MSNNFGGPGRGPPPTTTNPFAASGGANYIADGQYFPEGDLYSMGGQMPNDYDYDYSAGSYGPVVGQQLTYGGMSNIPNQLAPSGAPGGGPPPMSTFDLGAQYPNPYGQLPANRGPQPTYQTGMSMPVNTPPTYGRGSGSTGAGEPAALRPSRGGSPIRRKKHHKPGHSRGLDSIAAGAGSGQAPGGVGAPPNPIQGFGPATPAGRAAQPQSYLQGGYGQGYSQGYGQEYGPQQPGNPYLGPRNLGQFQLSTSQPQVGSSNDPGQPVAQAPQPKKSKHWGRADNTRLKHMRNTEGKTFDEIGKDLGCTESEARSHYQDLQRMDDAQEKARGRLAALAITSNPVPIVRKGGKGVKWTMENAVWMEKRLNTLTKAPENRDKHINKVLEMVAAEINVVNGTTVSSNTVASILSKLGAEKSGHRMDWG